MENLIAEITAYAAATGRKPQTVLRAAIGAGWGTWDAWVSGQSSPTVATVERLRAHIAANPAPAAQLAPQAETSPTPAGDAA